MNQVSSVNTGAAITTAGGLSVVLDYIFNQRWGMQMNPVVLTYISGGIVTVAHFLVNVINAQLAKDGLPQIQLAQTTVTKEAGYARTAFLLTLVAIAFTFLLSGCGTVNGWVAAKTNIIEQDAAGAVKNQAQVDDDYLKALKIGACNVKVGALARSPADMPYVMEGCPISNTAQVSVSNGVVAMRMPSSVPLQQAASTAPAASVTLEQVNASVNQALTPILNAITALQSKSSITAPATTLKAAPRALPPPAALPAPAVVPKTPPIPLPAAPVVVPKAAPSASMLSPTGGMLPAGK